MVSVIRPDLRVSIGHHYQFAVHQLTRDGFWSRCFETEADGFGGDRSLGLNALFRDVPASLDHVAGFQSCLIDTHSRELKVPGAFNRPPLSVAIGTLLIHKKNAVRIDSL